MVSPFLLRVAHFVLRLYWRICRPRTYGVKVLLIHPHEPLRVLLIRHAYGEEEVWSLPGGGYRPQSESPHHAAMREVWEELRVRPSELHHLGEVYSEAEGKRDTVVLFVGFLKDGVSIQLGYEIAAYEWFTLQEALHNRNVGYIAKSAIELYGRKKALQPPATTKT